MDTKGKKIILGSGSPRRKELLEGLGITFIVDTGNSFDEAYSPETPHEKIPEILAEGKSQGFHRELESNEILMTSDTGPMRRPCDGKASLPRRGHKYAPPALRTHA